MIKFIKNYPPFKKGEEVRPSDKYDEKTLNWYVTAGVAVRDCQCKEGKDCVDCQGKKKEVVTENIISDNKEDQEVTED